MFGHFEDEDVFGGALGLVFFPEIGEQDGELFAIFAGLQGDVHAEVVAGGVLAAGSFAFGGAWTGGVAGIAGVKFSCGGIGVPIAIVGPWFSEQGAEREAGAEITF